MKKILIHIQIILGLVFNIYCSNNEIANKFNNILDKSFKSDIEYIFNPNYNIQYLTVKIYLF
jgi:hypothetical protein